ncbi:hypothetical protein CC117_11555 [Parafrankia colletiae]|uniref:Uncharacterized protein n=1 Tax=Parafrankia colletiae TaxID=573497 RepID=A0A1S1RB53_9ACTN|nr:hypothetical protein CC117_11555 [Parafrankia colletiae]
MIPAASKTVGRGRGLPIVRRARPVVMPPAAAGHPGVACWWVPWCRDGNGWSVGAPAAEDDGLAGAGGDSVVRVTHVGSARRQPGRARPADPAR